jgi:hypothetical protein
MVTTLQSMAVRADPGDHFDVTKAFHVGKRVTTQKDSLPLRWLQEPNRRFLL